MSPYSAAVAPSKVRFKGQVLGSGGARATLAGIGVGLMDELAGVTYDLYGGISGGSFPALMRAAGLPMSGIVRHGEGVDMSGFLTRHAGICKILLTFLMKERYELTRPARGIYSSEGVGTFVESLTSGWPKRFWTMAVCGEGAEVRQVLFTADGVFEYDRHGNCRQLAEKPAPLGIAVRATCAIPGVIDAVEYQGRLLFDGVLTWDGRCPVGALIKHFGMKPEEIVACDVGEEQNLNTAIIRWLWKLLCGKDSVPEEVQNPAGRYGSLAIQPVIREFRSLDFSLPEDLKWVGMMAGFLAARDAFQKKGILSAAALASAEEIAQALEHARSLNREGVVTAEMRRLLSRHGLY